MGADDGLGEVRIVSDQSETLIVDVNATEPGALVLTDQYYPGWTATVNGSPVRITRTNYAFRLVPVPAGKSRVVFRYWPQGLTLGVLISAASILVVALATVRSLWWDGGTKPRLA